VSHLQLLDQHGRRVAIGRQIGRRGGEGSAYEATSHPGSLVKIYHEQPTHDKADKLHHLAQLAAVNPQLLSFAAWPTSVVTDGRNLRGFLMPLVKGKEIHQLFGPRERFVEFPSVSWDFLVHVARNCAAAFESIHRLGVVIGDVNEGNLMVTQEGLVRLIDCDSYQVSSRGHVWTCNVGIPLWTPPELQGHNFGGLRRTSNHDLFGLAVLIFKTLFMGRHPYAGIPVQHVGDFVLEKAIANYMFAFSPKSLSLGLRPPPHCLPLNALPQGHAELFEKAFMHGSEKARPTAFEWAQTMESLLKNLTKCGRDPSHKYSKNLTQCPWCAIAAGGGPNFFISVTVVSQGTATNAGDLWGAIARIEETHFTTRRIEDVRFSPVSGSPLPEGISRISVKFVWGCGLICLGLVVLLAGEPLLGIAVILFGGGLMSGGARPPQFAEEADRRKSALAQAHEAQKLLFKQLSTIPNEYQTKFTKQKSELRKDFERYSHLDQERASEMRKLEQKKRELQLRAFLDHQLIARARLPGIGPGRVATLQAYGIETALDVTQRMSVPGIGYTYTKRLLDWRRACEGWFQFDASAPIPAQELHELDVRINTVRNNLISDLKQGPQVLANLGAIARSRVLQLELQIDANAKILARVTADLAVLNGN
jgi:DNA-binding helix-hairpin-helix protein with protein kinase domain